jgi:Zn-dependent M16 (insulinase) family peptidase
MNNRLLALPLVTAMLSSASGERSAATFATLAEGQTLEGFRAAAVYLNDADLPMGARFVHLKSGFTLDLLEIQSVPQAFMWTTTFPTSNMGEPHTQEHLLLGKGNKGRAVASGEPMALANSTAFTMQWRTCYTFYSPAGMDVFYSQVEQRLDAMLHPDYSDEEIRREIRNFGIAENARDHTLRLEEKGTVYNEMVSSMDQPNALLWRTAGLMTYGPEHPVAFSSGGLPEALRIIQPADIRKFHREHYHLANMGMIASVPKGLALPEVLAHMNAIFNRVQPQRLALPVKSEKDLPVPQPAAPGEIRVVQYPHRNEQQPGSLWLLWPADREVVGAEKELLDLFLSAFGGDPTTNLYKRFIDSKTREVDIGAKSVFAGARDDQGHPVIVGFGDLPATRMNPGDIAALRARVRDELNRIAAWKDGSPELLEFNARLGSALIQERRQLAKFVNSPPTFGFRNGNSSWLEHLYQLNLRAGFRKSVTLKPELAEVERLLQGNHNLWTGYLAKWKLTGVEPWAVAMKPNPKLIRKEEADREERIKAELAGLQRQYGVQDEQEAIRRYRDDYDRETLAIDKAAASVSPPKFIDNPPLTLDDQLEYKVTKLTGGVPLVASTFDGMTSATAGIALRTDGVAKDQLVYLAALPRLLTSVGVIDHGKPVSYEEMSERLKKEILGINASFSTNPSKGRVELALRGSGNDASEARKALEWMNLVLYHPDWRPENLARIRDVVDQELSALRRTTQRPEETWVDSVASSYRRQDSPQLLTADSFMTRMHFAHRLRWMLKDAGDNDTRAAVTGFLEELGKATGTRDERKALLAELQSGKSARLERLTSPARELAVEAAKDLELTLPDLPDSSLAADWSYLCGQIGRDLNMEPRKALAALDTVRRQLLHSGNARMFLVSSSATQQKLRPGLLELAGQLDPGAPVASAASSGGLVQERLRQREPAAAKPVFVGLLNPNSQGGVFLNSAPAAGYEDTDRSKLLDYLSTNLYGGRGAHGIFMKTWAAGLAYSNGIRMRPADGRLNYYAERTPELPQTLRFVIAELKRAPKPDAALIEYAIAESFAGTRAASPYEVRGEAMAADLADGLGPEVVARFRKSLLALRKTPDLAAELYRRMNQVYGTVLPGLSVKTSEVKGGIYLVIGPEKQFAAWEDYLKTSEGPDTKLYRLYPRDFWITD